MSLSLLAGTFDNSAESNVIFPQSYVGVERHERGGTSEINICEMWIRVAVCGYSNLIMYSICTFSPVGKCCVEWMLNEGDFESFIIM